MATLKQPQAPEPVAVSYVKTKFPIPKDASKWADALIRHHPHLEPDRDILFGWFANAIVHSLDLERGTVINGEHAEYLMEKGITPHG